MRRQGKTSINAPKAMILMTAGFVITLSATHLYSIQSTRHLVAGPGRAETGAARGLIASQVDAVVGDHVEQIAMSASALQGFGKDKVSAPPSQPEADEARPSTTSKWTDLPRNRRAFEDMIVNGPLESDMLLRNHFSNPRDIEIPTFHQELLKNYCAIVGPKLRALHDMAATAAGNDLIARIASGQSRVKTIDELDASLLPREKKVLEDNRDRLAAKLAEKVGKTKSEVLSDPTTVTVAPRLHFKDHKPFVYAASNGSIHSATAEELPNAIVALSGLQWACMETASVITGFFGQHGCLDPAEADSLIMRVLTKSEQHTFGDH